MSPISVSRISKKSWKFRIERIFDCGTGKEDYLFNGIIKNKSEFKKFLKQINLL
jgi:hypothetical protein